MKKIFLFVVLSALAVACSSSQKQNSTPQQTQQTQKLQKVSTASGSYAKYQIVDQEFENFAVKNDGYDRVPSYEEQINSSSYIQSTSGRSKKKPGRTVEKTVVNEKGQILSSDAVAPVTDKEVIPAQ
jgi:hypothetical protein